MRAIDHVTLRDFFAAAALTGLIAQSDPDLDAAAEHASPGLISRATAEEAYRQAEAMLQARTGGER